MQYTADITIIADAPLTEDTLADVAAIGGGASGTPGAHRLSTMLTVEGDGMPAAAAKAIETITRIVPGAVSSVEVMSLEEQDRRLAASAQPVT